jgi:type I restriction enzyme S subunit
MKQNATLKKYEAYKPSSVEWLGEIPEHWQLRRFKYLFREINERSSDGNEELLSVSQYTGVTKKSDKAAEGEMLTNAATLEGYKKVYQNDLVSNIMLAWNGSMGFSPYDGITSPAYSIYRLGEEFSTQYFHYLLRTDLYKSEFKRNSSGVIESRLRLYSDDFYRIWSLLPPFSEQAAIAAFLDDKIAKIDTAIAQKEQLIQLLQERKQIMIQEAVTKGLDKTVKLKDSGVEWIGDIPAHWEVKKLKFLTRTKTGEKNTQDKVENGKYPFYVRSQKAERINSYSFDGEAILTAGDGAGVGKVYHYVTGKFDYHQRVYKFSHFRLIEGKLLFYYLSSLFYNVAILGTAKSTVDSLRLPLIQNFEICFSPESEEQRIIISFIEKESAKIEKAVGLQKKQIKKLKEYKNTLIDSTVRGKIKVC